MNSHFFFSTISPTARIETRTEKEGASNSYTITPFPTAPSENGLDNPPTNIMTDREEGAPFEGTPFAATTFGGTTFEGPETVKETKAQEAEASGANPRNLRWRWYPLVLCRAISVKAGGTEIRFDSILQHDQ